VSETLRPEKLKPEKLKPEKSDIGSVKSRPTFAVQVGAKAERKLKAQRNSTPGVWFGLGMMGLVGWSVAVPTLIGAGCGLWLDEHHPGNHSWTLALLVVGLVIGCLNAWHWVDTEDRAMREDQEAGGPGS
jgi:ATP synthase protein I